MTPRKVLRIARWESARSAGTVDRRTAVIALALLAVAAVAGPLVVGGVSLDSGIYRVGVAGDSPYAAVVASNDEFSRVSPDADADLRIVGHRFAYDPGDPKSRAAFAAFRSAIADYNDGLMAREDNESAAFPVSVTLRYESRPEPGSTDAGGETGSNGSDDGRDGAAGPGGGADDGSGDGTGDGGTTGGDGTGGGGGGLPGGPPAVGGGLLGGQQSGTPGDISPPFPFQSLVLAFVFVVPMNFVVQAYGSTIMDERIRRRGELLLVAPVSRWDIIAGKTLPYFGVLLAVTTAIAVALGGGPVAVAAVVPVALVFLSATFVAGMFARSFKELSFVTVTLSVVLTSYVFVPAIFTDVTPIALISPLTVVVRDLQGVGVTAGQYAFSTAPFFLSSLVLFALGAGVYREEDMFSQRPLPRKARDAIAARVSRPRSAAVLSALSIPFVFLAELLGVAVLFALPVELSVPILLGWVAVVEEVAKSVHLYAGYAADRFDESFRTSLLVGGLSGLGFFVGEKLTLVSQLVGLPEYSLGRAAFTAGAGAEPLVVAALLLAPLALHATTASVSALGARRSRRAYLVALAAAIAVHVAYNLAVVSYAV